MANRNDDTGLTAGFVAPDTPAFYDIVPPIGSYAGSTGYGVFTADGGMSIICKGLGFSDGGPDWGGSRFAGRGTCYLSRGGDSLGHGSRLYTGRSTVMIDGDHVVIACRGSLVSVAP